MKVINKINRIKYYCLIFFILISINVSFNFIVYADNVSINFTDYSINLRNIEFSYNVTNKNFIEVKNNYYYENKIQSRLKINYKIFSLDKNYNDYNDYENYKDYENSNNTKKLILDNNISFELKWRKYSIGKFKTNIEGNYEICGKIIESNYSDNNSKNNHFCKIIKIEISKNKCDLKPKIFIKDKISQNKIFFKIYVNDLLNKTSKIPHYILTYWIEDISGNIIKKKLNTTNNFFKTFSIKSSNPKTAIIKAKIIYRDCQDINQSNDIDNNIGILYPYENNVIPKYEIKNIKVINNFLFLNMNINLPQKESIELWIECNHQKISNIIKIKNLDGLSNIELTIPFQNKTKIKNIKLFNNSEIYSYKLVLANFYNNNLEKLEYISFNNSIDKKIKNNIVLDNIDNKINSKNITKNESKNLLINKTLSEIINKSEIDKNFSKKIQKIKIINYSPKQLIQRNSNNTKKTENVINKINNNPYISFQEKKELKSLKNILNFLKYYQSKIITFISIIFTIIISIIIIK